jgi:aspartyl aminopeptidase
MICVSTIGPFITEKRGIDTMDTAWAVFASWGK